MADILNNDADVPQRYPTNKPKHDRKGPFKLDPQLLVALHPNAGSSQSFIPTNLADLLQLRIKRMMGEIEMAVDSKHEAFGVFWRWATDADTLARCPGHTEYRDVYKRLLAFLDSDDSDD